MKKQQEPHDNVTTRNTSIKTTTADSKATLLGSTRRRLALILISYFSLGILLATPASATENPPQGLTVDDYSAYLAEASPQALGEFNELSDPEKEQFIKNLKDPRLYTEEALKLSGVEIEDQSLETQRETTFEQIVSPAAISDKEIWSTRWVKVFGIKVIEFRVELGYRVANGKVTAINSSAAYTSRNYNPLVQTETLSKSHWIAAGGSTARLSARFSYNIGPLKGLSVQLITLNAELTGTPDGQTGYRWWGE